MMWCYPTLLAAAYPAVYGQFQQALTQGATLLPTTQKEGEKGQKSTSSHWPTHWPPTLPLCVCVCVCVCVCLFVCSLGCFLSLSVVCLWVQCVCGCTCVCVCVCACVHVCVCVCVCVRACTLTSFSEWNIRGNKQHHTPCSNYRPAHHEVPATVGFLYNFINTTASLAQPSKVTE